MRPAPVRPRGNGVVGSPDHHEGLSAPAGKFDPRQPSDDRHILSNLPGDFAAAP